MSNRTLISGTLATTSVLVALGVAIGANLVASQTYLRLDLTENQIYTLGEASRQAVSGFEEPIEVKVFLSPDLPAPFHTLRDQISDTLTEYAAASGGQLTFQVIEPREEPAAPKGEDGKKVLSPLEEEARGYGCEKVAIGQRSEDEVTLRAVFKCVAFVRGERTEVIKDLRVTGNPEADNFEYAFTKALLNLKATASRKVGFVSGFGGVAASPGFIQGIRPAFREYYGALIEPVEVDLSAATPKIPTDVTALILFNPTVSFTPTAKYAIDQFLLRGGSLGWFQSSSQLDPQVIEQMQKQLGPGAQIPEIRSKIDPGLNEVFSVYGVTHRQDLILDRANALTFGVVRTPQGPAQVSHPATFQINALERDLPFLAQMPPLALPGPASLEAKEVDGVRLWEALKTAPTAVRRAEMPSNMSWEELRTPQKDEVAGSYLLAAALQGSFPSAYPTPPDGVDPALTFKGEKKPGRIFVVGSGEYFGPNLLMGFDQRLAGLGQQMLFGSIEWLAQDSSLSSIRAKAMPRFVGEVDRGTQRRIQFINIVFVPALFLLIGIGMRLRRDRRRRTIAL